MYDSAMVVEICLCGVRALTFVISTNESKHICADDSVVTNLNLVQLNSNQQYTEYC